MITVGWLLYAILLVIHFVLAVPGILLMATYWDDEYPTPQEHGVHRTLYLFLAFTIGFYAAVWVLGLLGSLFTIAAGVVGAVLTEGVVVSALILLMLFLGITATKERSYRRG